MKNLIPLIFVLGLITSVSSAQRAAVTRSLTAADYRRAEKFMGYNTGQLVDRGSVRPNWLPDERFWYRVLTAKGSEFILVDPARGTRVPAFDHARLAAALSTATGKTYDPARLPFTTIEFSDNRQAVSLNVANKRWRCDVRGDACAVETPPAVAEQARANLNEVLSPDKKKAAFIRDWNLWIRDIATGKETRLTTDGIKDFGYATDNAGWRKSDRPVLLWSPDSKKIATFQQDQRGTGEMYLVTTNVGHPKLEAWKYPLPGDKVITTIQRVIIEADNPKVIRLQTPPDEHRSTLCDDIVCSGNFDDNEWSRDGKTLAFVSTSRDHKRENLRIADAATGVIRDVMEEISPTQFESGQGSINWKYLPGSNEFIWYSERDNWGHLYLYDLASGKLKQQITKGDWTITQVLKVDEQNRTIYFLAASREPGRHPYFEHLYSVGFDGGSVKLLTPEDGNHVVTLSPSGRFFVDSYSKQDVPAVIVLRDPEGKTITDLEKTDISRLRASGWKPAKPIVVKARDNVTDLYGLMYTPTNLDTRKKYPVVNYIYPGPQGGSIGGAWSFIHAFQDHQALAELGFIVVAIEGTCNPLRSKKFHDACYGNMADNTLPDQITGIKQLAQKHRIMDLTRVGIWGHSGGGYAAAAAMFRYPDFYKVGISESGNHDNRNYEDDWGERYIGLLTKLPNGKDNYESQANQVYAKNLKGRLLLAHGMMDDNVPPSNTLLVVDALVKANKDFDLLLFPHARHGYGSASLYMTRRRWDYFVKHLMGANPPNEYELKSKTDPRNTLQ